MKYFRFLFFLAAVVTAQVHASEHTGYWIENTPMGEEFKCRIVKNKDEMTEVLKIAGWKELIGLPRINWQSDEAVVISPKRYDKRYDEEGSLKFDKLIRKNNKLILYYKWEPFSKPPTRKNVIFEYSVGETEAQTIIVSYKRELNNGGLDSCCLSLTPIHSEMCVHPSES